MKGPYPAAPAGISKHSQKSTGTGQCGGPGIIARRLAISQYKPLVDEAVVFSIVAITLGSRPLAIKFDLSAGKHADATDPGANELFLLPPERRGPCGD